MAIFTVEAIIKLIAMRSLYFKHSWNVFDFVVVISTTIVVIMNFIPGNTIDLKL